MRTLFGECLNQVPDAAMLRDDRVIVTVVVSALNGGAP